MHGSTGGAGAEGGGAGRARDSLGKNPRARGGRSAVVLRWDPLPPRTAPALARDHYTPTPLRIPRWALLAVCSLALYYE